MPAGSEPDRIADQHAHCNRRDEKEKIGCPMHTARSENERGRQDGQRHAKFVQQCIGRKNPERMKRGEVVYCADRASGAILFSPERKHISLDAGVEKLDLE